MADSAAEEIALKVVNLSACYEIVLPVSPIAYFPQLEALWTLIDVAIEDV